MGALNWDKQCEDALNRQIQLEYWASYQYDLMWTYFDSNCVAFDKIARFYKKAANEEREHAHALMTYQNLRGGTVVLTGINPVDLSFIDTGSSILSCFQQASDMEQVVYDNLKKLPDIASSKSDHHFADFITTGFLDEQLKSMDEIKRFISQLTKIDGNELSEWLFNQNFNI